MPPASHDIIIIGAGASGLAAACAAAERGASVLVIEKNHIPGRKVLSSGAGKCNFTNLNISPDNYLPCSARRFIENVFKALPPAEISVFFENLGLLWTANGEGRVFPRSMKAQDVVSVLVNRLTSLNTTILTLTEVVSIKKEKNGFIIETTAVAPPWNKESVEQKTSLYRAARVLTAAGGPAHPQIGGSAKGCGLLESLGHSIVPQAQAIVPLKTKCSPIRALDGVRVNAALRIKDDEGGTVASSCEELLFTDYGISGPAALEVSAAAISALTNGPVFAEADLFPDMPAEQLERLLLTRAAGFSTRPFSHFACGLMNEKIMRVAAELSCIDWSKPSPGGAALAKLVPALKEMRLEIAGARGYEDAMSSSGGCDIAEIDPASLESRKVEGLYVTGELLNVTGDCGGYNLHFAWTSGIIAGRHAASLRA
jgi:predicted Rossmann fold flavoprotein